jgi:hypothetical protein
MVFCPLHQEFGVDIGGIDDMFPWRELTGSKRILNERRTLRVMHGRRRRMDVSNQRGLLLITGLGIVHHVAQPMRVPFGTIPGIEVIGGFELLRCTR